MLSVYIYKIRKYTVQTCVKQACTHRLLLVVICWETYERKSQHLVTEFIEHLGFFPKMDLHLERVIQKALEKNLLTDEQPSFVSHCFEYWKPHKFGNLQDLFDLDYFQGRVDSLKKAFPEPFFNHAMAVKANSIRGVLLEANRLGLGGECASLQEAKHCLSLGKTYICLNFYL